MSTEYIVFLMKIALQYQLLESGREYYGSRCTKQAAQKCNGIPVSSNIFG